MNSLEKENLLVHEQHLLERETIQKSTFAKNMASVTSLDGDLRRLRLEKYTPAAANEAKQWIESVISETLPGKDLLEVLKDGVALCK